MKRFLEIIIASLLLIQWIIVFPVYADDQPAYDYITGLGYRVNDNGTDGVMDRRVMLLENDNSQVFGFTENGHSYTVMNFPQYMARFDINDLRRLFCEVFDAYEWDVALYCPDFKNEATDRYAVTYGLEKNADLSDANYTDPAECIAALAAEFDFSSSALSNEAINLDGMSYDELVTLKDQINLAIWNSAEWQEVTVPQGRWIVGQDIPAGKWTVKCADVNDDDYNMNHTYILWSESLESDGDISFSGRHGAERIYNPNHRAYEPGEITECIFDFKDGDYVIIENKKAPAVFTPYSGKPSLGFK